MERKKPSPVMANARGLSWPQKGGLNTLNNGGTPVRLDTIDKQTSDFQRDPSFEELIAEQNANGDEFGENLDGGEDNADWIRATVDNLGRIFNDISGPEDPIEGVLSVESSTAGSPISRIPVSIPGHALTLSDVHHVAGQKSIAQADHLLSSLIKQSSACSQVTSVSTSINPHFPKFTVTESGLERLSSEDRACLEEIERGSQLTAEERELLENSKKEFQVLDFQDLEKSELLNTQDLVNQALDNYDASDDIKTAFTNCVVQNCTTVEQDDPPPLAVISNPAFTGDMAWEPQLALAEPKVDSTQAVTNPLGMNPQQTLQIVLQDDQGQQQVLTIDQKSINDSLQKIQSEKVKNSSGKEEDGRPPIVCSLNDITVQDGFLVILVDANSADQLPKSVESEEPVVRSTSKNGQSTPVNKQWMCSLCGHVYDRLSKLKTHIMKHTGERPFKCPVMGCKWGFTTPHKLKRHLERHLKTYDFKCEHLNCGKKFTTIYNLRTHAKVHQLPPKHFCTQAGCVAGFQNSKMLDKHLKDDHGITMRMREKKFECPHPGCGKRFVSLSCISTHKRVHERDDLTCPFEGCNKIFSKNCRLQQHLLVHTGERPFKCQVEGCAWAFQSASKLKRHMNRHLNDRPFACTYEGCGKRFLRSEHLKGHLISHTGEKPFCCPVEGCSSRFSSKSSMYVHAKQHRKVEERAALANQPIKYYCPMELCNQAFDSKPELKTHIEEHYKFNPGLAASHILPENVIHVPNPTAATTCTVPSVQPGQSLLLRPPTIITPTSSELVYDFINTNDHLLTTAPSVGLPTPMVRTATLPLATLPLGQPSAGGLISVPVVISPELSQLRQDFLNVKGLSLSAAMGGFNTLTKIPPTTVASSPGSLLKKPTLQGQGSARTDAQVNKRLMERSLKRRQMLTTKAMEVDVSDDPQIPVSSAEERLVNPNEILTSQAITFRDPETGAILIQTQLLQDDPPDVYQEEDPSMAVHTNVDYASLDGADLASILADTGGECSALPMDESSGQFAGTTINLHDLQ